MSKGNESEILEEFRWFMKNRVVFTAAELRVFDVIGKNPGSNARELASHMSTDERALTRLLDCLVGLDYLEKRDGVYYLSEKGQYMSSDHPSTVLPMVLHSAHLWKNWTYLTETVKLGTNPCRVPVMVDDDSKNAFIQAMHVIGRTLANNIVESYDAFDRRILLDIGGGSGIYTIAFLNKYPSMQAIIFDLPEVIPIASERIREEGLDSRVSFVAGNFYRDNLPQGCDFALLSAIIHQNSPEENIALYKSIFKALEPGGKLLIRDHIMDSDRVWPPGGALFAINMLVSTPGGDTYTFSEVEEHLLKAGFRNVRLLRRGHDMDCLVEAFKE